MERFFVRGVSRFLLSALFLQSGLIAVPEVSHAGSYSPGEPVCRQDAEQSVFIGPEQSAFPALVAHILSLGETDQEIMASVKQVAALLAQGQVTAPLGLVAKAFEDMALIFERQHSKCDDLLLEEIDDLFQLCAAQLATSGELRSSPSTVLATLGSRWVTRAISDPTINTTNLDAIGTALNIGPTNATAITIGSATTGNVITLGQAASTVNAENLNVTGNYLSAAGNLTLTAGNLSVSGGASTLTANGNVVLGSAGANTVNIAGRLNVATAGSIEGTAGTLNIATNGSTPTTIINIGTNAIARAINVGGNTDTLTVSGATLTVNPACAFNDTVSVHSSKSIEALAGGSNALNLGTNPLSPTTSINIGTNPALVGVTIGNGATPIAFYGSTMTFGGVVSTIFTSPLIANGGISTTAGTTLGVSTGGANAITIDPGGAAALNLGTTNANAVNISKVGTLTRVYGNLQVDGTTLATGLITASGGVSGNLTGNVTGAASLNVLKAGDTMTGALYANGGVDRSAAAALNLGTTNANAVNIGAAGTATPIALGQNAGDIVVVLGSTIGLATSTAVGAKTITVGDSTNVGGAATLHLYKGSMRFHDNTGAGVTYVGLQAPTGSDGMTYTLPAANGTTGQALTTTTGTGVLSWSTFVTGGPYLPLAGGTMTGVIDSAGTLSLGTATATAVSISRSGQTTTVNGPVTVSGDTVNLANGANANAKTVDIATGGTGAITMSLASLTGGAVANSVTIASGANTGATTVGIATGTADSAKTITVGDSTNAGGTAILHLYKGSMRFHDNTGAGVTYVGLQAPTGSDGMTYTLPAANGTTGQALTTTTGTGVLSWSTFVTGGPYLPLAGGTMTGVIDSAGTLSLGTATATAVSISRSGQTTTVNGLVTVSGDTVNLANGANANAKTVDIATGGTGAGSATVGIASGSYTGATTIDMATGTGAAADKTVNIATGGTGNAATLAVTIAAVNAAGSTTPTTLNLGTGIGTGVKTINIGTGSAAAAGPNLITIGSILMPSTITIGQNAGDAVTAIGNTIGLATDLGTGAKTVNIATGGTGAGSATVGIATGSYTGATALDMATSTGTSAKTVNIATGGTGAGTATVGVATGAYTGATIINIATGTGAAADKTVNIATGGTGNAATLAVTIAAVNAAGSTTPTTLNLGTGIGTGVKTINIGTGSAAAAGPNLITIGSILMPSTITIGQNAGDAVTAIGNTIGLATDLGTGAKAVSIATGGTGAGSATVGIATGSYTGVTTIDIATGTGAAADKTVNIATGGTGNAATLAVTIAAVNAAGSTTPTTLNLGTGIGTGVKTINIGTGSAAAAGPNLITLGSLLMPSTITIGQNAGDTATIAGTLGVTGLLTATGSISTPGTLTFTTTQAAGHITIPVNSAYALRIATPTATTNSLAGPAFNTTTGAGGTGAAATGGAGGAISSTTGAGGAGVAGSGFSGGTGGALTSITGIGGAGATSGGNGGAGGAIGSTSGAGGVGGAGDVAVPAGGTGGFGGSFAVTIGGGGIGGAAFATSGANGGVGGDGGDFIMTLGNGGAGGAGDGVGLGGNGGVGGDLSIAAGAGGNGGVGGTQGAGGNGGSVTIDAGAKGTGTPNGTDGKIQIAMSSPAGTVIEMPQLKTNLMGGALPVLNPVGTLNAAGIRVSYGTVSAVGGISNNSSDVSAASVGLGLYTITVSPVFSVAPVVVVTGDATAANPITAEVLNVGVGSFQVQMYLAGGGTNEPFHFIAIGAN